MVIKLNTSVRSSYRHLAIIFLCMATVLTFVRGVFQDVFGEEYLSYLAPFVVPFGVLFFVFIVRLIKNLGVSPSFVRFVLFLLVAAVLSRASTVLVIQESGLKFISSLISSSLLLLMQSICVYFMSINLFIEVNPIREKLWASVCVYFMIAATFGTIYSILITVNPSALGIELYRPIDVYIMGMVYSYNVLSGLDPIYEYASETVRMTAVLESIFTTLFMVILIGRLLGAKAEE